MTQIAAKEEDDARLLTVFRRGRLTLGKYEQESDQIVAEREVLRRELAALHAQQRRHSGRLEYAERYKTILAKWQGELERIEATNDREAMQKMIEDLVSSITVNPGGVHVEYSFECVNKGAISSPPESVADSPMLPHRTR